MKLKELEIKIAIEEDRFREIFEACNGLFGAPTAHYIQLDEYYDTPDGQLKKQDLVIRIRSNGEKKTIALKSPRITLPSGMTERIELEFISAEGENVQEQLLDQGLNPGESAEKERWTFMHNDCEIVLDRLPFIGAFMEIEGPTEEFIYKIMEMLGLSSCPAIRKNYGELMKDKFRALGLSTSNICATFAKEALLTSILR